MSHGLPLITMVLMLTACGQPSRTEAIRQHCEPALENAHEYAGAPELSPLSIEVCTEWYAARASAAELSALRCMAGAETEARWNDCRTKAPADAEQSVSVAIATSKDERKIGKKGAKMRKPKGNKVEMKKKELDREIMENAGVLGALREGSELDGVFGNLNDDLAGGIGGLIGAKGTQTGSGGLGSRGSGLGGGGSADGIGGLGTKGRGTGKSGYGSGGGNFGKKGAGGISKIGGDPIILGALDKSLIDPVVKRHMNQIRYCYQRGLTSNPGLGGKIVVKFVISKDGSVSKASTKSSTMGNKSVEGCINSRFQRFKFPEPKGGGIVIVSYPFVFQPG